MKRVLKTIDEIPESWKLIGLLAYTVIILVLGWAVNYFDLPTILMASALLFIGLATLITSYKASALEKQLSNFLQRFSILSSYVHWEQLKTEGLESMILSMNEVKAIESGADEIWVLTPDFYYDIRDFEDVILNNLRDGKKYVYLFPSTTRAEVSLDHLKKSVLKAIPEIRDTIESQMELYKIESDAVPLTMALYNPFAQLSKQIAVVHPHPGTKGIACFVKLLEEQLDPVHDHLVYLRKRSKRVPF